MLRPAVAFEGCVRNATFLAALGTTSNAELVAVVYPVAVATSV